MIVKQNALLRTASVLGSETIYYFHLGILNSSKECTVTSVGSGGMLSLPEKYYMRERQLVGYETLS